MSADPLSATGPTRADLWAHVFGPDKGIIGLFSGRRISGARDLAETKSSFFEWPSQENRVFAWLYQESSQQREAYVCAHLLTKRRRVKHNAARMWALYVDGDGAQVGPDLPRPTATVESSPGRHQFYWRLSRPVEPTIGEQLNKRLAKAMGADMSGWDLTQLLRPPGTFNNKYQPRPRVEIREIRDEAYDPDELDRILPPLPVEAERPTVRLAEGTATVRDDDQARIDKMLNGKRGAELRDLWNGGSKHRKPDGSPDVSADDQSVMNALAFYLDKDPSRMASAFLSSGRDRSKLHERHSADGRTYLEMTIGTAIAGCSQSYGDLVARSSWPTLDGEWSSPESAPIAEGPDELAELRAALAAARAEITRRGGVIDDLAEVIQVQQVVIQAERDRLETIEPIITAIDDILARPDEELNSDDKIVDIGLARWLPFHRAKREANGELPTVALGYLSKVIGMPPRRISKSLDRQSSDEPTAGAPFRKRVTRKFLEDEQRWESSLEVQPWGDSPAATLRAAATYATPPRPKRGGSQAASDARWGRCDKHDNREVLIKGHCPDCGKVLGERTISLAEFDGLNVQVGHSEEPPAAVGVPVLVDVQNGHSDGAGCRPGRLNLQPVHSADPPDELAERRATAVMAIPTGRVPDKYKTIAPPEPEPVSLGRIKVTLRDVGPSDSTPIAGFVLGGTRIDLPDPMTMEGVKVDGTGTPYLTAEGSVPWRCPECPASERKIRPDGSSRCARGHVSHDGAPEWGATVRELAPGVIETRRVGETGAVETIIGRDPNLPPPDDLSITGWCPRCGPDRILRRHGAAWSCASCRQEVTA